MSAQDLLNLISCVLDVAFAVVYFALRRRVEKLENNK